MITNLYCVDLSTFDLKHIDQIANINGLSVEFSSEKRKREYLVSNWLRYTVFSEILAIEKDKIEFFKDKNDRPFLSLSDEHHYDFNISHSGKWVVMAVTDQTRVGVDIEGIINKYSFLAIAERFFSKEEIAFLKSLQPSEQIEHFYLIWTLKEATLKCSGQGIAKGLNKVNFLFDKKQIMPLSEACGYQYISFRLDHTHIGSVCLKSEDVFLPSMFACYQFDSQKTIKKMTPFYLDVLKHSEI